MNRRGFFSFDLSQNWVPTLAFAAIFNLVSCSSEVTPPIGGAEQKTISVVTPPAGSLGSNPSSSPTPDDAAPDSGSGIDNEAALALIANLEKINFDEFLNTSLLLSFAKKPAPAYTPRPPAYLAHRFKLQLKLSSKGAFVGGLAASLKLCDTLDLTQPNWNDSAHCTSLNLGQVSSLLIDRAITFTADSLTLNPSKLVFMKLNLTDSDGNYQSDANQYIVLSDLKITTTEGTTVDTYKEVVRYHHPCPADQFRKLRISSDPEAATEPNANFLMSIYDVGFCVYGGTISAQDEEDLDVRVAQPAGQPLAVDGINFFQNVDGSPNFVGAGSNDQLNLAIGSSKSPSGYSQMPLKRGFTAGDSFQVGGTVFRSLQREIGELPRFYFKQIITSSNSIPDRLYVFSPTVYRFFPGIEPLIPNRFACDLWPREPDSRVSDRFVYLGNEARYPKATDARMRLWATLSPTEKDQCANFWNH